MNISSKCDKKYGTLLLRKAHHIEKLMRNHQRTYNLSLSDVVNANMINNEIKNETICFVYLVLMGICLFDNMKMYI
jgi:hypothetical protein